MGRVARGTLGSILLAAAVVLPLASGGPGGDARASVLGDPAPAVAAGGIGPGGPAVELALLRTSVVSLAATPTNHAPSRASTRNLLVSIDRTMPVTARPGGGAVVGSMPAESRFYGTPTVAWVRRTSADGRFGLVDVPYAGEPVSGWIRLRGLERSWTRIVVVADLSEHRIEVRRAGALLFRAPAATGATASPTPLGRYVVTDRVPFPAGGTLGTFAFGISGIQTRLPVGWTGGDQLAIHGTNDPSSIGTSASAGCLRVAERILDRLMPLLRLGTPVIVRA